MNLEPRVPRHWIGRLWRFAARHRVGTTSLLTVLVGVTAIMLLPAGGFILLLLSAGLLYAASRIIRRTVRMVRRLIERRRVTRLPQPVGPPIEQIATDLRRLLWEHDSVARSADGGQRRRRLLGLELAITERARQAARALEVPHPDWSVYGTSSTHHLRRLLNALAAEGLVLPPAVGLLAPDSHY